MNGDVFALTRILNEHLPHATRGEVLVALVALGGLIYSIINARSARGDYSFDPKFLTRIIWIASVLTVALHTGVAVNAWWAMFHEPPPPAYREVPQSVSNLIAWIYVSSLATLQSFLASRWRQRLGLGAPKR